MSLFPHATNTAAVDADEAHFTADQLRALTRRELQALAKRFMIKANAKSSYIIDRLTSLSRSPCTNYAETEPIMRSDHFAKEADKGDHKENCTVTSTAQNAILGASPAAPHTASVAAAAAKSANVTGTVAPPCSPCNSIETESEQSLTPICRTDHSTENDSTNDKAYSTTAATETHHVTLEAHNVTHTTNAAAKQPRVKRGSHPAARRQRKRIAAARAAAAASESPPHQEETSSPCSSKETEFEQTLPTIRRTDHSDHYQTDAMHTVRKGV